jgi:Calcineurin-like phosphoesterase
MGSIYEDAFPRNPTLIGKWLGETAVGAVQPNQTTSIGMPTDDVPCRIGIVADIHQNSLFLTEVLKRFEQEGVTAIFALGDYCFTRHKDTTGIRARQVGKVMELLKDWLKRENRLAFVLTGNHEMEEWYFGNDASRLALHQEFERYRSVPRLYLQDQPFRSFDIDNAWDIVIGFGPEEGEGHRRSFRLSHAVTTDFVTALYQGLDKARIDERADIIKTFLGGAWLQHQNAVAPAVSERWNRFLNSRYGTAEFKGAVTEIYEHLRREMRTDSFISALSTEGGPYRSGARAYRYTLDRCNDKFGRRAFREFWAPPMWHYRFESDFTGVELR